MGDSQVYLYWQYFEWQPNTQKWLLAFECGEWYPAMVGQSSYIACKTNLCNAGVPKHMRDLTCGKPPYLVEVHWAWSPSAKKWEHLQTESNWHGGPHTCFGCPP